jgi:hypothetical protein
MMLTPGAFKASAGPLHWQARTSLRFGALRDLLVPVAESVVAPWGILSYDTRQDTDKDKLRMVV